MFSIDVRTVLVVGVIINLVAFVVLLMLWRGAKNRFPGLSLWMATYALQVCASVLSAMRGALPAVVPQVIANGMIVGGFMVLFSGLRRFAGKMQSPALSRMMLFNHAVLVAILIVETYFTIWAPSLESRAQALSAGLLVVSFECMWLTLLGVERKMRSMTRGVGVAFALMGLICLARIIELGVQPPQTDDLLKTTAVDAWILLGLEGSFAVLTFALVMMVNGRLLAEARDNEAQIRRRTLELEAANKGLEAYNYSVSHDLLGDVKSLDMFSQSLLNEQGGSLSARGKELVHYIQACGQSMSGLIGDMLNLSRVGRAGMAVETVDMSELARTIAEELRRGQPERNVEFIIPPGMVAEGDPALLKIALQNLLSNAWKYTAKVERAVVEFGSTQDYGERVYFVRDNGVGFDAADSGRLFRPFQRLHPVAQYPGNGVGLAIVQRAIDRHGGRVWAFGVPGKGATFYFTLPAPK